MNNLKNSVSYIIKEDFEFLSQITTSDIRIFNILQLVYNVHCTAYTVQRTMQVWDVRVGCQLAGCHLAGCQLVGCHLTGCYLAGCYLSEYYLAGCHLAGCYLAGCYLAGCYILTSYFRRIIKNALLTGGLGGIRGRCATESQIDSSIEEGFI